MGRRGDPTGDRSPPPGGDPHGQPIHLTIPPHRLPLGDRETAELDADSVLAFAQKTNAVVTVEEHNVYGGMGSAIAEALMTSKIPIVPIGVKDRFGQSAMTYEELLVEYGLTEEAIAGAVRESLSCK